MEIRFSLDAADLQRLTDETIAARLASNDQLLERIQNWQKRLLPGLLLALAIVCAVLAPRLVHGRYSAESVIALLLALPALVWLWRRHAKRLGALGTRRNARIQQRSNERLAQSLRQQLAASQDRLLGLHVWQITTPALLMTAPNGAQVTISWSRLANVTQTAHFYRLASGGQRLMGLAHVLPKHSREQESQSYQDAVAMLLRHCQGVPRR